MGPGVATSRDPVHHHLPGDSHLSLKLRGRAHYGIFVESAAGGFDPNDFKYDAVSLDVVLLELLSAVDLMLRSPDVQALEASIRKELGAEG